MASKIHRISNEKKEIVKVLSDVYTAFEIAKKSKRDHRIEKAKL